MSNIVDLPPNEKSGLYKGPRHSEGGIQSIVDGQTKVEIEGEEFHICQSAIDSDEIFEFVDKSNKQILEKLFREEGCVFTQGKSDSGDFIVCRLVVLDDKKRTIKGTVKQILNTLQSEKSCKMSNDATGPKDMAKEKEEGGDVCSCKHDGIGEDENATIPETGTQTGAGIVLVWQGNILLVHPTGTPDKGNYCSIPKGLNEDGEEIFMTAIRELYEETGLVIRDKRWKELVKDGEPLPTGQVYYKRKDGSIYKQVWFYVVTIDDLKADIGMDSLILPGSSLQEEEVDWGAFVGLDVAMEVVTPQQLPIINSVRKLLWMRYRNKMIEGEAVEENEIDSTPNLRFEVGGQLEIFNEGFTSPISSDAPNSETIDNISEHLKKKYIDKAHEILELPYADQEEQSVQRKEIINWILKKENDTKVIIAFSGGKDSVAMVLYALELGIPKENIELWHHEVDGNGKQLFDWKCTHSYCVAFAKAFGLKILFSYAKGGILREIYRENETIQPIYFQKEMGGEFFEVLPLDKPDFYSTRRKFPAVGADLNTRWCSWIAKIGVMNKAINNSEKYKNVNLVVMTGERRQESTARSKYVEIEKYRSFTKTRRAISWRPIIDWSEKEVWQIFEKYKVQPHPCYELGWGRCSCQICIFSSANTWASINEISPEKVETISEIERDIKFALYSEKKKVDGESKIVMNGINESRVNKGKSFIPPEMKERWMTEALGEFISPIIVENWKLPIGAYNGENSGAN